MRGDIGFDKVDGGPGGRDIASFSTASAAIEADLAQGSAHGDGRDQIGAGTEDLVGSAYPDILRGNSGPNRIDGGAGYDELEGRGGGDELLGGPDGADCGDASQTESCEKPNATGSGTIVVYSRSLDGGATLVVRGTEASNDIRIALSGGSFTVSDSRAPVPAANVTGCEPTGSGASCPGDAGLHPRRRRPRRRQGRDRRLGPLLGRSPARRRARRRRALRRRRRRHPRGRRRQRPRHPRRGRRRRCPGRRPHRHPHSLLERPEPLLRRRGSRRDGRRRPLRRRCLRRRRRQRQRQFLPLHARCQSPDRRRREPRWRRLHPGTHRRARSRRWRDRPGPT